MHITGTQVRMHNKNQECVTSLVSLHAFAYLSQVINNTYLIYTRFLSTQNGVADCGRCPKNNRHQVATLAFRHLQRNGSKMCRGFMLMICRSHPHLADKTGVFYTGSKNSNHPLFDKHEKSKEHMNVAQAIANKQASQEEIFSCPLARWLNEEQWQALCNIFLLVFHKAKHARPMSSYSEDIPLLKWLGVNVRGAYHSREGGTWIMQSIAHTISGELRAKLQSAEFLGLRTSQKPSRRSFTLCLCPATESLLQTFLD